ncbi:DoxX family protein [Phormidium tenue]|uniref:DoxX family protein n=1 Tax=Phormidium tenue NIES-30 TaxID=549789 RepID=A0A1U7J6X1_9CYAN|nr:DoxX family protein [Phormidium tenue]MBD2232311.1 DoxX family protein [Phormidium tenue FACHB-1052]OKH48755.1 DoxX family protein [Phormidium tenue NIES-30]
MIAQQRVLALGSLALQPNQSTNTAFQISWTILRIVAGVVMVHNGLDKLANIESFANAYVAYLGLPFPITLSYMAAFTELIGAPLVALGLFTRPAAMGLVFTMLVAMYHHIKVAGFSIPYLELSALYAATFLFFVINGGGQFSLDALLANVFNRMRTNQTDGKRASLEDVFQRSDEVKPGTKSAL